MVKIFIRIIKHELDTEEARCEKEKRILDTLGYSKLTKKLKKYSIVYSEH
jgi:hypothetical protein